jgi:hypothetical protein
MKAEADPGDQAKAEDTGPNSVSAALCAEADLAIRARTKAEVAASSLMEAVVERDNLWLAYQRVVENKGAAGVDALTVSAFKAHLQQHWPTTKGRLLAGTYQPQPVRRVDIPKPQGGVRTLGIPTVVDSSKHCIRCCNRSSSRGSRMEATAFGGDATRIRRCVARSSTWRAASAGWSTWTWRSSSIGSTTMF